MKLKILCGLLAGLAMGSAGAAEPAVWSGEIVPSLWVAGLSGNGTVAGHDVDFNRSFGDVLDHLDVGGSLAARVTRGRLVVGGQIDGYNFTTDDLTVDDRPLDGELETDLIVSELAAGYVFPGWKPDQSFAVALGARHAHVEADLDVAGAPRARGNLDLLDPMLILWPSTPLFPAWIRGLSLVPAISIGGGHDSELVYELYPQLRYQATAHLAVRFGYRTIGYRTKDGADELDFDLAGFIAGLGVSF